MRLDDLTRRIRRLERADDTPQGAGRAQALRAAAWRADAEARYERIRQQVFPDWGASRGLDGGSEKGNSHDDE